jgi:hypothetical protein
VNDWNEAVFWPAFKAAGMLDVAQVLLAGSDVPLSVDVDFSKVDVNPMTGVQSTDYEIEYQFDDLPTLAEDDQVIIRATLYRVRQVPRIEGIGATGYFRKATLTEVRKTC